MFTPTLADKIIAFNEKLHFDASLPEGVEVMNPFRNETVRDVTIQFYQKYFSDNRPRRLILGINPGRFGAGVTGIPFTDPVKLRTYCEIENPFADTTEASAGFVYEVIGAFGGVKKFYDQFLISAVSPLGFTRNGLNYNYYDSKELVEIAEPFILDCLRELLEWEIDKRYCFCLGNGKNFDYLQRLNARFSLFGEIIPLPHPRWVIQYRRKRMHEFVNLYLEAFENYNPQQSMFAGNGN